MSAAVLRAGSEAPLRIGLVAGEHSGDQLGAALIAALRARVPQLSCFGVAGPRMIAAGCEAWAASEELGVMGSARASSPPDRTFSSALMHRNSICRSRGG